MITAVQPVNDASRLEALRATGLLDSAPEPGFDRLTRLAATVLNVPIALVSLVDEHRQFFKSCFGLDEPLASARETPLSRSFCQYAVASGEPLLITDARVHPLVRNSPAVLDDGVVAYAGIPLRTAKGVVLGSFCVVDFRPRTWSAADVTILSELAASAESEIELRENRRALTTLLGNLPGTAYRCRNDPNWTVEMASQGILALTGYSAEDLVGNHSLSYAQLIHPEDRDAVWEQVQAAIDRVAPFTLTYRIVHRDGSLRWVEERGHGVFGDSGELLALEGFIADVTEHRYAEVALRESEERYRTLLRHYPDGAVFLVDHDLRFLVADGKLLVAAGYDPQTLIGRHLREVLPPEDAAALEPHYRAALAGEERAFSLRAAGRTWECIAVPVRDTKERVIAGMVLSRDVTNQVQAEIARAALEEQLRQSQKMDAIGRLAGGVAHDFNNLLTVIKGSADFLCEDLDGADPRRQDAEQIRAAADRASGLTRQLLAFSRKQILNPKALNLNSVILGVRPMLERLIGEDVTIQTELADDVHLVMADAGQIEQVLMNLVLNARDAMTDGGTISVSTRKTLVRPGVTELDGESTDVLPGAYVRLAVRDSGVGIPADVRPRIFEPFFSTKEAGRGTGLGLSTVYGIVRQSGGVITVSSSVGSGSAFVVYLPMTAAGQVSVPPPPAATPSPDGRETILLVEDENALRALAARVLTRHGYTVLQARNGREALDVAAQYSGPIELLLTDVVMPIMGGRELASCLHRDRPGTAVLYMSGYTDDEVLRRGVLVSETAFVMKPFTSVALLRAVRGLLDAVAA